MKLKSAVFATASIMLLALCGAALATPPAGFVPINSQSSSLSGNEGLEEFFSKDGVLEVTLAVSTSDQSMPVGEGGTPYGNPGALEPRRVLQCLYGKQDDLSKATGKIPFFRLKPGDELRIHFVNNQKTEETNLHFHGLAVSPSSDFPKDSGIVGDYVLPPNVPGMPPGGKREYSIRIAKSQKPGLYWYHAHAHSLAREQVSCGLTGPLYVEGEDHSLKQVLSTYTDRLQDNAQKAKLTELVTPKSSDADDFLNLPHSIFVLRDYVTKSDAGFEGPWEQSINGHPTYYKSASQDPALKPYEITYSSAQGKDQLWLISNQSANLYYLIEARKGGPSYAQSLTQPYLFRVVSRDGIVNESLAQDEDIQTLFIPPGGRMTVAVHTSMFEDDTVMIAKAVNTQGDQYFDGGKPFTGLKGNPYILIKCIAESNAPLAATENVSPFDVLRNLQPSAQSFAEPSQSAPAATFVFDEPQQGEGFYFYNTATPKGKVVYDPNEAASATLTPGKPVDWIIQNKTPEWHAFHIHQVDFRVLKYSYIQPPPGKKRLDPGDHPFDRDGKPDYSGDVDVVSLPPNVQVRIHFDMREGTHASDPFDTIAGTFVAHCHILEHEDGGMMANINGGGRGPVAANGALSPSSRAAAMLMPREISRVNAADLARADASATALNLDTVQGRYSLVTFGYTTCDGTCTGTVEKCNEALRLLGPQTAQVNPIFVSVDRVRDNSASLAEYKTAHSLADSWRLFVDQDGQAANAFGVRTLLGRKPDGSPLVRHSPVVYLIGPNLDVLRAFYPEQNAATMMEGIRASLDNGVSR